jgi:hypothetical protein
MSRVDATFGALPAQLLADWGQDLTYLKTSTTSTYDTTTGVLTNTDTAVTVRGIITQAKPEEFEGFYQTNDVKVILGHEELGDYYPNVKDRLEYSEAGSPKTGRIISCKTLRGESPIYHTLLVRPQ